MQEGGSPSEEERKKLLETLDQPPTGGPAMITPVTPPPEEETPPPPASPITTDAELKAVVGNIAAGNQGSIPKVNAVLPTVKDNELLKKEDVALGEDNRTITAADAVKTVDVKKPTRPEDETYGVVGDIERTKAAVDLMG